MVRVLLSDTTVLGQGDHWLVVSVTHVLRDSAWVALRESQYTTRSDSLGAARFELPLGVYQLAERAIGYSRAEAVVQIRGTNDSLRVFVSRSKIC